MLNGAVEEGAGGETERADRHGRDEVGRSLDLACGGPGVAVPVARAAFCTCGIGMAVLPAATPHRRVGARPQGLDRRRFGGDHGHRYRQTVDRDKGMRWAAGGVAMRGGLSGLRGAVMVVAVRGVVVAP